MGCLRTAVAVVLFFVSLSACDDDNRQGGGVDAGLDGPPVLQPFATYELSTRAEFSVQAAAPGPVDDGLSVIRSLQADPAAAIVAAAGGAGVPTVDAIYGVVPDVLKSKLNGWINSSLRKKDGDGQSLDARLTQIVTIGEIVLTDFGLDTTLVVTREGEAGATHRLNAVRFFPPAPLSSIAIPRIPTSDPLAPPDVPLTVKIGARSVASLDFAFGSHRFSLPYGEYAWLGWNGALHASSGSDMAGLLVLALDCVEMAKEVSGECVGPLCVGHKADLQSLCEKGRAGIIARVESKVRESGFDAVDFQNGSATLMSGAILNNGIWKMRVTNGSELRDVPAVFTGVSR